MNPYRSPGARPEPPPPPPPRPRPSPPPLGVIMPLLAARDLLRARHWKRVALAMTLPFPIVWLVAVLTGHR